MPTRRKWVPLKCAAGTKHSQKWWNVVRRLIHKQWHCTMFNQHSRCWSWSFSNHTMSVNRTVLLDEIFAISSELYAISMSGDSSSGWNECKEEVRTDWIWRRLDLNAGSRRHASTVSFTKDKACTLRGYTFEHTRATASTLYRCLREEESIL